MTKTYYSKVSYGLLAFIFSAFFVPVIPILIKDGLQMKIILLLLFLAVVFGFILHLFFKTLYTIDSNILKIKSGFISYKPIDINTITQITKSNSAMSSPAASFDRIEIKYGKFDEILISPKNKLDFINDLIKINPSIKNNSVA